ncbi:MAG: hypothetical protein HFF46_06740 [Lawsonibacter sp.]|jgi:hypothetical protein|nr:hypothetical protein [Lawsonibacter sp.]MCI9027554.1 hypothetical protein [Lawsonibacter sp.]
MKVLCTPVTVFEEDMRQRMQQEGKFSFNHLLIRRKEISRLEIRYVEYFILDYQIIHKKAAFFRRDQEDMRKCSRQQVFLLGNGSTGATSFMETQPQKVEMDIPDGQLQKADYGPEQMRLSARTTLVKLVRRHMGGRIPDFQLQKAVSIYRPFWLIYYGETRADGRQLCSVRSADGYSVGGL